MSHQTTLPHQTTAGRADVRGEVDVPPVSIQPALYGVLSVVSIRRILQNGRHLTNRKHTKEKPNRQVTDCITKQLRHVSWFKGPKH